MKRRRIKIAGFRAGTARLYAFLATEPLEQRTYFSPIVFARPVLYPTGTYPSAVVTADLTDDGNQDVITANFGSSNIAVLRGNGDGTLDAPVFYPVGDSPESIATGDFNGDGIPDIVVANEASNTISVLQGNGDGTFQPQVTYATGMRPEAVAVADLTGDGHLDIITADQGSNSVSVFMNTGTGTFGSAISYDAGLEPDGLAVGDLNGDGLPDIVTVNPVNSNVHVLTNQGAGTFKITGTYDTGSTARAVAIADMNTDGRPDIITSNLHGTSISVLTNNGDNTFADHTDYGTGAFPFSITVADVNGDGRPEVITANNYDNTVGVLVRNGMGGFFPELSYHGGKGPVDVAVADLNNDGRPDLIAVDFNSNQVSVDLNETHFVPLISTTITVTPRLNPVEAGNNIVLTAQVTPSSPGKSAPVGVVQFFNGDAVLAVSHVNRAGIAKARVHFPLGSGSITAHYAGDSIYAESTSPVVIEQAITPAEAVPLVTPTIAATHLPAIVVPGDRGVVTVSLSNESAGVARGVVSAQIYASADGQLDSTAFPIASTTDITVNLTGGNAQAVNLGVQFPAADFEPGTYTILAVLTPVQGLTDSQVSQTPVAAATTAQAELAFGSVGTHRHTTLTRMENGSLMSFQLSGPGTGVLTENPDGSISLAMSSTTAGSTLRILPLSGSGLITLDGLTDNSLLGFVTAPTTNLTRTLSVFNAAGAILGVRGLTLAGVTDASITFGGSFAPRLTLGTVNGLTLFSYVPLRVLDVTNWSDTAADQITAPWIRRLSSAGDFGASLTLSGSGAPGHRAIQSAVIGGSLGNAVWNIGANLTELSVGGVAAGWSGSVRGTVDRFIDTGDFAGQFAGHDFGSVLIDGNLDTGDILAGADFGTDGRLGNNDDFFGVGSISLLQVNGSITDSLIAAGLAPLGADLLGPGTTLQRGAIHYAAVAGNVDSATRILAQTLPSAVSIDGITVDTASDPRFQLP